MARNNVASIWPEADGKLRERWKAGVALAQIGRELGVSPGAIAGRAYRLDLGVHPSLVGKNLPPRKPRNPLRKRVIRGTLTGGSEKSEPPRKLVEAPPEPWPTRRLCQFIAGNDRRTWRFCDAPCSEAGSPWCAEHRALVFHKRSSLAEVA